MPDGHSDVGRLKRDLSPLRHRLGGVRIGHCRGEFGLYNAGLHTGHADRFAFLAQAFREGPNRELGRAIDGSRRNNTEPTD